MIQGTDDLVWITDSGTAAIVAKTRSTESGFPALCAHNVLLLKLYVFPGDCYLNSKLNTVFAVESIAAHTWLASVVRTPLPFGKFAN
jgi:hypothetical protein